MTLIVVRHGRTVTNAEGRLLGRSDPPLDDVGWKQAQLLASQLGRVDRVISSPLLRARETAAILAGEAVPIVPVDVDDRWIEINYGSLEGARMEDVPAALWAEWRADIGFEPPGGGESLQALGRRVREACELLLEEAADRDVVVVTHVSPIKAAAAWALGIGDDVAWRMHVTPASVTRIGVRPQGPILLGFNSAI